MAHQTVHGGHTVVLISAGWNKQGGDWIQDEMPDVDFNRFWHRIDWIFDSQEHLDWFGTESRAQEQFLRLFPEVTYILTGFGGAHQETNRFWNMAKPQRR